MANFTRDPRMISGMDDALPIQGDELIEIVQDGVNRHIKVKELRGAKGEPAQNLILLKDSKIVSENVVKLNVGTGIKASVNQNSGVVTLEVDSTQLDFPQRPVRRTLTLTNNQATAYVTIFALGTQTELDAVEVNQTGGSEVSLSKVSANCFLQSVSIAYDDGFNQDTEFTLEYPEPFGETDELKMNIPMFFQYSHANPPVLQPPLQQNYQNNNGIVRLTKVGLIQGKGYHWKYFLC